MSAPEVQHRIAYGHLDRETWRDRWDAAPSEPVPLDQIVTDHGHTGGVIGYAGEPRHSPAIIVHNRPPDQIEVRLRWLGARVDIDGPLGWLYAPDVADMMLDRRRSSAVYTPAELRLFLLEWAAVQDWGREPVIRES